MAGLVLTVLNIPVVLPESWLIGELIRKMAVEHNYTNCILVSKVKVSRDRPRWPKGFQVD